MNPGAYCIENLAISGNYKSKRESSWDRSGGNIDYIQFNPKESKIILNLDGAGCIKHIYFTNVSLDPFFYRNTIIKIYWDEEKSPSVEVPLGDFFGIGHCRPRLFSSKLLSVNPGNPVVSPNKYAYGINSYFPMPFSKSARVEIENQSDIPIEALWYHIDYQLYDGLNDNVKRFHAKWNREITIVSDKAKSSKNQTLWDGINLDSKDNYNILDTEGDGQLVGIMLYVDNISGGWWGEGDDMVFIDGDTWPPSIHGTGTEEIFGGGACPAMEYNTDYCGFHLISNRDYSRHNSMYRFFVTDPIRFKKSIRYTIEHGHGNNFENDYSSVAYWYQQEPHVKSNILPVNERMPLLMTSDEKEVIKKQTRVLKEFYDKNKILLGNPVLKEYAIDILKRVIIAENSWLKAENDLALKNWIELEKIIKNI